MGLEYVEGAEVFVYIYSGFLPIYCLNRFVFGWNRNIEKGPQCARGMRNGVMKTLENDTLAEVLIDSVPESEQICSSDRGQSILQSREETQPSAETAARIEQEVNDLLLTHTTALSRYAMSLSWDKTIVQDGIQEAFLRYFATRIRGQKVENPRAWLFRVLRNYLLDCNRRSSSLQSVDLNEAMQIADRRQDVEAGYQQDETFRRALASLSPREQECMQLRFEGFGYDEIAQILQIRTGTVGALLARGLKKIRNTGLSSRGQ